MMLENQQVLRLGIRGKDKISTKLEVSSSTLGVGLLLIIHELWEKLAEVRSQLGRKIEKIL